MKNVAVRPANEQASTLDPSDTSMHLYGGREPITKEERELWALQRVLCVDEHGSIEDAILDDLDDMLEALYLMTLPDAEGPNWTNLHGFVHRCTRRVEALKKIREARGQEDERITALERVVQTLSKDREFLRQRLIHQLGEEWTDKELAEQRDPKTAWVLNPKTHTLEPRARKEQ